MSGAINLGKKVQNKPLTGQSCRVDTHLQHDTMLFVDWVPLHSFLVRPKVHIQVVLLRVLILYIILFMREVYDNLSLDIV